MVSIIFPVYNVAPYLDLSIQSILDQDFGDIEIIAVNDGSTDKSLDILKKYTNDERIKIINQSNQGAAKARLTGLEYASGDYVAFVDSDDTIPRDSISTLFQYMNKTNADIVIGNYLKYYSSGAVYPNVCPKKGIVDVETYIDLVLSAKVSWGVWGGLYKRNLFSDIRLCNFRLGEDACLLIQVLVKAHSIALTDYCVYRYLQRDNSTVHVKNVSFIADMYNFRVWIIEFLQSHYEQYQNKMLMNLFIVKGYIACVLLGGKDFLPPLNETNVRTFFSYVKNQLAIWEKAIYFTLPYPHLNKTISLLLRMISQIRK